MSVHQISRRSDNEAQDDDVFNRRQSEQNATKLVLWRRFVLKSDSFEAFFNTMGMKIKTFMTW